MGGRGGGGEGAAVRGGGRGDFPQTLPLPSMDLISGE